MSAPSAELPADLVAGLRRLKLATMRRISPELLVVAEDATLGAGGAAAHPRRG